MVWRYGAMVDGHLSPKVTVNSFGGSRENDVYGWTARDAGRPCHDSSSAVQ